MNIFKTEQEAREFIEDYSRNFSPTESAVITTLSDEIISQEHFSFYEIIDRFITLHSVSLLEKANGFEVETSSKKLSLFVHACEIGDLKLAKSSQQLNPSDKAIAKGLVIAIINDRENIVSWLIENNYSSDVELFENPLETATIKDSLNSFKKLLLDFDIPTELLAKIFHNNSISILKYILGNSQLCEKILRDEKLQTDWVKRLLSKPKYVNPTIELYKKSIVS